MEDVANGIQVRTYIATDANDCLLVRVRQIDSLFHNWLANWRTDCMTLTDSHLKCVLAELLTAKA